ncbi:MAG TPA: hypothetical protein PLJ04_02385, partial [Candidatus Saccharibacteria bacterium]|nr:hypothetical protein [Candidatus Saccharibacteria bacterium]
GGNYKKYAKGFSGGAQRALGRTQAARLRVTTLVCACLAYARHAVYSTDCPLAATGVSLR